MKPGTQVDRVNQRERKRDLLDAVQGMPSHHKAVMMARIMKAIVAGKISPAEANELRKAAKI